MATTEDGKEKARKSPEAGTRKKTGTRKKKTSARKKAAGTTGKKKKKRQKNDEPTPVFSGRLMLAAVAIAAMVLIPFTGIGNMLERKVSTPDDTAEWKVGSSAKVHVTLITADYAKLSCASDQAFKGYHCAYESETKTARRDPDEPIDDNKKTIIQPYRTAGTNKLIMIAGLWAQPALATRLHFEPSRGVSEKKLARFVADCDVNFVGEMKQPKLRWSPSGKWITEGDALVAVPRHCSILKPGS